MSPETTVLKPSAFLSLKACQAAFSLASRAASLGPAMETAMLASNMVAARLRYFFMGSFRGWGLNPKGRTVRNPASINNKRRSRAPHHSRNFGGGSNRRIQYFRIFAGAGEALGAASERAMSAFASVEAGAP